MRSVIVFCILAFLLCSSMIARASGIQLPQTEVTYCYDYYNYNIYCGYPGAGGTDPPGIGQDGAVRAGMPIPLPRFGDDRGTYKDALTGLVWLANPTCNERIGGVSPADHGGSGLNWSEALIWTHGLAAGFCGLGDGSVAGDWRLPNVNELKSLYRQYNNSNFFGVDAWSSTTDGAGNPYYLVNGGDISVENNKLSHWHHPWGVRDGVSGAAPRGEIPKTGQSISVSPYDDGSLQKGVAWPNPRFLNNGNGAISDLLTGLVWLKNAACLDSVGGILPVQTGNFAGAMSWGDALLWTNNLASGSCGLTDGSVAGEWRLPNQIELNSLGNFGAVNGPAWLTTQGFILANIHDSVTNSTLWRDYWSSNSGGISYSGGAGRAVIGLPGAGIVSYPSPATATKSSANFVLPVRGGVIGYGVTLRSSPMVVAVPPGGTGSVTITTTVGGGITDGVILTASDLPLGVTATFTPSTVAAPGSGSTVMTLTAAVDAPLGSYPVTVIATGGGMSATATVTLSLLLPLTEALDTVQTITTGGDVSWFGQRATTHDGSDAAQAGVITHSEKSYMESTVTGPATVSFWWKVSSEAGYDFLHFSMDGVEQKSISGEVGWIQETYVVASGSHTLHWEYTKDVSTGSGADTGWVDELVVTSASTVVPLVYPQAVTVAPGSAAVTTIITTVMGGFSSDVALSLSGLPTGISASFSPATIPAPGAGSSVVTFTAVAGTATGNWPVTLTATGGGVTRSVAMSVTMGYSLAEALDTTNAVTSSGNLPWFGQTATTHDGTDAAQSGAIGDSQSSRMETVATGPVTLSYWWKVSSEQNWDFLRFSIDGVEQIAISGSVNWTNQIHMIPAGSHLLRWEYTKDGSLSSGSDAGWVDNLAIADAFTLAASPPALTLAPGGVKFTTITMTDGFADNITLAVTGLPPGITASFSPATVAAPGPGSTVMTLTATTGVVLGSYSVMVTATGGGVTRSVTLPLTVALTLAEALDTSNVITTGGGARWFGQTTTTHDGIDAAQAGAISGGLSSYMDAGATGPATISFWWKVSSESGYDYLRFSIDGVEQKKISGELNWAQETYSLTSGAHVLRWEYTKDASTTSGSDSGWVDQFVSSRDTATTLTSGANPVTYGANATFSGRVSPSAATGTITFYDGGALLGAGALSGGAATLSSAALTGGSHNLIAVYGGDSSYNGSTGATLFQAVTRRASATTVTSGSNPVSVGTPVTFTAIVTESQSTGTVTFKDGTTVIGTGTLIGGTTTCSSSALAAGSHSITAVYSGDGNSDLSTSAAYSQTVNKITTSTSVLSGSNPSAYGAGVTFTATVTPGAATGKITIKDGVTTIGTGVLAGGSMDFSIGTLDSGSHSITGEYGGDSSYGLSTSSSLDQIVGKGTQAVVTLTGIPATPTMGDSFTAVAAGGSGTGAYSYILTGSACTVNSSTGAGAVIHVSGGCSVTAVRARDVNYNVSAASAAMATGVISKATSSVTAWPMAATITYGQTLASATLSGGAATPAGTFAFTIPATAPVAGSALQNVTFTPTAMADYMIASGTVTVTVNKGTPTISWATPVTIMVGTPLSATQLNATASVPGAFVYAPVSGTVMNSAGAQTLWVNFAPTDAANYNSATASVSLVVSTKLIPTITWVNPAAITYGTPLSETQLNATASVAGTFVYAPVSGTVLAAGTQTLSVTFTPTDTANYAVTSATVSLTVNKGTPVITWGTPAAITYGTPLSGAQLNATASVAGTFVYAPASGTVLVAGTQTLSVTFTPTDSANYATTSATVSLTVNKGAPVITWANPAAITYGTPLSETQ